jgi:hypothetical protein
MRETPHLRFRCSKNISFWNTPRAPERTFQLNPLQGRRQRGFWNRGLPVKVRTIRARRRICGTNEPSESRPGVPAGRTLGELLDLGKGS